MNPNQSWNYPFHHIVKVPSPVSMSILPSRGMMVDHFEPGLISCSFKVPPRLTDRDGSLASNAVANLVDIAGNAVAHKKKGETIKSICRYVNLYISPAKVVYEIVSRLLGQNGGYYGIAIVVNWGSCC